MATIGHQWGGYSKQDGKTELRDAKEPLQGRETSAATSTNDGSIPELYKKEPGSLSSLLIVVISGGDVREYNYLQELSIKHTFPQVKLIFLSSERNKGGLTPRMMLEKLDDSIDFDEQIKSDKILISSIDKIFMVTDVDHYYEELAKIIPNNDKPKVIWVVSNPCFEIWLYYSHFDHINEEIRLLESIPQSQQSSKLKTINDIIFKGGIDPRKAFDHIQTAIENAKNNFQEDKNGIPKLFSTNMYVLGEYILDAIGKKEFDKWLEKKQEEIEAYRKKSQIDGNTSSSK